MSKVNENNEAAERLILKWLRSLPDETRDLARDDVHRAMRAERRGTVERIRTAFHAAISVDEDADRSVLAFDADRILDEEAAR